MKKFETRRTAIYNTPVKISSPGDIGLSQPEPMFEVGWDCHSPCDEGNYLMTWWVVGYHSGWPYVLCVN